MGNVDINQQQLWASLIMAWVFTLIFLHLINAEYKEFAQIRQKFFQNPGSHVPLQTTLSCLVENLPKPLQNDISLKAFFEELFPGDVHSAVVAQNLKRCEKTVQDRAVLVNNLENIIAKYEATDKDETPLIGLNKNGKPVSLFGGEKVSAFAYYKKEIQTSNRVLQAQQKEAHSFQTIAEESIKKSSFTSRLSKSANKIISGKKDPKIDDEEANAEVYIEYENEDDDDTDLPFMSTNGFVTFNSVRSHAASYQMPILIEEYPDIKVTPASAPSDYLWSNITFSRKVGDKGSIITSIILWTGVLFWAVIIAFIGAVSNLENLSSVLPFISSLDTVTYSIIAGILPVVVLAVFMSLLPAIFAYFAVNFDGKKTNSDVQEHIGSWGFLYSVANVYLLLFTGSLFNLLAEVIDNPPSIVPLLGAAIPSVAVFFINFFIAKTFFGLAMVLARIVPLIIVNIYTRLFKEKSLTIRGILSGPLAHVDYSYGDEIPDLIYVITAALLYWLGDCTYCDRCGRNVFYWFICGYKVSNVVYLCAKV